MLDGLIAVAFKEFGLTGTVRSSVPVHGHLGSRPVFRTLTWDAATADFSLRAK
jgi:hypothetical protein